MKLNDLPDEVLEQIFDNLDLYELKLASLVCRRWSTLTFSGQRMDRVWLNVPYTYDDEDLNDVTEDDEDRSDVTVDEVILNTKRKYRNISLVDYQLGFRDEAYAERLLWILRTLKLPVRILNISCDLTSEQSRLLLLETPELQHLQIDTFIESYETGGPFPDLQNLKSLVLNGLENDLFDFVHRSVTNLQSLDMNCTTDFELEAWKHLSGQLKDVYVNDVDETYLHSFLELTFPILEKFAFDGFEYSDDLRKMILNTNNDFFRRHPFLRRLSLPMSISIQWVESIVHHCPELTHLDLLLENPEEGYLESLSQLTKLRHLSVQGEVDRKMFCGALKSLEIVELKLRRPGVLLENLFEVAPRLNRLKISCGQHDLLQLQFICENFSYLQHLEVNMGKVTAADNSVRFDRLAHLQELTFFGLSNIRYIHRNNVRCLTIYYSSIKDDELKQIPEKFPALKRLIISGCFDLSLAGVERLHQLMPSCRIDYNDERFYPVGDGTSN